MEQEALELAGKEPGEKGYSRASSQKSSIVVAEGKMGQDSGGLGEWVLGDITGREFEEAHRFGIYSTQGPRPIDRFYKEK